MAPYLYSLQKPAVFKKVSKFLNFTESRTSTKAAVRVKVQAALAFRNKIDRDLHEFPLANRFSGTLFRGVRFRYPAKYFTDKFVKGNYIIWYTLKSATEDERLTEDEYFCGPSGDRTVFKI